MLKGNFSKFYRDFVICFDLHVYISFLLKMTNRFSWPAKIMASPFISPHCRWKTFSALPSPKSWPQSAARKKSCNSKATWVIIIIIKGSQLGAFCSEAIVYCYHGFKLHYLKNQKLFSIRVKELFWPIVMWKLGNRFLLFLKAFSWETDLWVTLGDFTVKNAKLGREICI